MVTFFDNINQGVDPAPEALLVVETYDGQATFKESKPVDAGTYKYVVQRGNGQNPTLCATTTASLDCLQSDRSYWNCGRALDPIKIRR